MEEKNGNSSDMEHMDSKRKEIIESTVLSYPNCEYCF